MKILNITAQKPHSTGSGIYMTELVNNWGRLGYQQAVVAGIYENDWVNFANDTVFYPVTYLSEELPFPIAGMSDEMPYESTRYRDFTEEMMGQFEGTFKKTILNAVKEFKPDMIVCHHLYLLAALVREWCPDAKIIGICHGSDLRQICKNPLKREYIKEQICKLDGISALHEAQKEEIMKIFGCGEDKIKIIGAGYNQRIFHKEEKETQRYRQIVFAGKVSEKKGVFSLIRALEKLPYKPKEIVVKIVGGYGNAEEYQMIRGVAEKCKYQIEFLGALTQRELADVFCQSDVFVLPSFYEGLPLVTMEAMACGCKVVCSEVLGMKKWLDENVPGHQVEFVELPEMENIDEPKAEALPDFEQRLAEALQKKIEQEEKESPNLDGISWKGISKKLLHTFR